jgi:hypothetical protein
LSNTRLMMRNLDKRYSNQNDNNYGELTPSRLRDKRGTIDFSRKRSNYADGEAKTSPSVTP